MRFLIDECLSVAMAVTLREADHDAEHVTELGLAGRPDDVVMEAARTQDRVLVSADTDFGTLLARTHHTAPSVVLFRGTEVAPDILAALLLANLDQVGAALDEGAIVVILDDRIRVRHLPIGTDRLR